MPSRDIDFRSHEALIDHQRSHPAASYDVIDKAAWPRGVDTLQNLFGATTKKPPLNGGISQVIPITWRSSKCSAFRQVCAVDPLYLVDCHGRCAVIWIFIHRLVEKLVILCCRLFFKKPATTGSLR